MLSQRRNITLGRGCIYIQFSTLEDMAEHGEKIITYLEKEKVEKLNNHLVGKMIDLYDEKEEFVVCLNVTSIEECCGWFQTAIININTKTARIAEKSTQPISFLPSYIQKINDNKKAIEHNNLLFKEKETEITKEEEKIRESLGKQHHTTVHNFTNFIFIFYVMQRRNVAITT